MADAGVGPATSGASSSWNVESGIVALTHPAVFVGLSLGYLASAHLLRKWMATRKPVECGLAMRVYNAAQVAVNLYLVLRMASYHLPPNVFAINSAYDDATRFNVFVHYLCKTLDFMDTAFIILRKKDTQLTFLHVYHHATIGAVWGYLLYLGHGNGTAGFGAYVNSLIHLMMYSHYLVTSFGIKNPFKVLITRCQLLQFYSCLLHVPAVILWERNVPKHLGFLQLAYHITMVLLFSDFYARTYKKAGSLRKPESPKAAAIVSAPSSPEARRSSSPVTVLPEPPSPQGWASKGRPVHEVGMPPVAIRISARGSKFD